MRKVIESTLVSLDGVIEAPGAWTGDYFDSEAAQLAMEQLTASDAMLMGKRTYEMFAAMWPAMTGAYADRMNSIRKYVFSSTLQEAGWDNTTIVRGDVAAEVSKLRQQDGQDLVIYGHGLLGQTLLAHHLLDELRLWVHPLIVGAGGLFFRAGEKATLRLAGTKTLGNGVVVLTYQPVGLPRHDVTSAASPAVTPPVVREQILSLSERAGVHVLNVRSRLPVMTPAGYRGAAPGARAGKTDPHAGGPPQIVGGSTAPAAIGGSRGYQRPGVVLSLRLSGHGIVAFLGRRAACRPALLPL